MVEITLDGPGMNALSFALMSALRDQLLAAAGQPVLLTGAGKAFSAGLDLKEVASLDPAGMTRFLDLLEEVVGLLYHHAAPTVAYVNGHAIAGGCVLALCCDRRICVDGRLRVGLNEVAIGLRFPPRTLRVVRRQIPARHAHEVLLGAQLHGPADALRAIAAFRLAMPRTILRYAGGRELTLGDLGTRDGLLGGINAVIVGNYLTTLGRDADEDLALLTELKMPIKELSKTL